MALARITTWVDGNTLTAAALNAEFNNILNNPVALLSPSTGILDMGLNQVTQLTLEKLATDPAVVTTGRVFFNTAQNLVKVGVSTTDASSYLPVGPARALSRVSGLSGSLISNIGSFAARGYQLSFQGSGIPTVITATSSFSVNTQTAGPVAGGRDQAAAFASTDIHFYAFQNTLNSTNVYGICSSTPPPVGPTGTQYWTYLCSAKYAIATSVMSRDSLISGSQVSYTTATLPALVSAGGATVLTTLATVAALVPSIATQMRIEPSVTGVASTTGEINVTAVICSGTSGPLQNIGTVYRIIPGGLAALSGSEQGMTVPPITVPVITTPPALSYQNLVSVGTSATTSLTLVGFTVPNGDN